jgi:hypothetical protein
MPRATALRFPILQQFAIANYQLFPGAADRSGTRPGEIEHEIVPGVTAVVGINGLGKTTLLNALFRLLSGPVDWKVRTLDKPAGSSPITLSDWKTPAYFSSRVGDDAVEATIAASVRFGTRILKVSRSLQDLALRSLSIDDKTKDVTETAYRTAILELSGLSDFEDFFLLLRYLVFVLEERPPIVWDADAQADLLRVLFFDAEGARQTRELFDEIQRADSRFRNLRPHLKRLEERLNEARAAAGGDPVELAELRAVQTKFSALEAQERDIEPRLATADQQRRTQRLRLEQAKLTLEEKRQEYAVAEQQHFMHVFPGIADVAQYVFIRAGGGCLVCGDRSGAAEAHVQKKTEEGRCPLCNSEPATQENVVSTADVNRRRLERLDSAVGSAASNVRALEAAVGDAIAKHHELLQKLVRVRTELEEARSKLEEHKVLLPPAPQQLEEMDAGVKQLKREMRQWERKREIAEAAFEKVLHDGEQRVRRLHRRIADRFAHFVQDFVAEACDIEYSTEERRVGQEGEKFSFPRFTVRLTSAVSPDKPQPRRETFEVSESQKEFIDLAFRMALMEVAPGDAPLMLVLETPEASLDTLFVNRAGKLFGDFARRHRQNRVIATSNLTKGDMIGAMLGAVSQQIDGVSSRLSHYVPPEERPKHVIDLLSIAAPNAALRENRAQYQAEFRRAVYPDLVRDNGGGGAGKRPAARNRKAPRA